MQITGKWLPSDKVDMTSFWRYLEALHNVKNDPNGRIPLDLEYLVDLSDQLENEYVFEEDEIGGHDGNLQRHD